MSNYDTDPTHVKAVQAAVNAAGYVPPLVVDGVYGPNTAAGVKWFQGLHGLTQDGIIGDATMAATISTPPGAVPSPAALVPAIASLPQAQSLLALFNPSPAPAAPTPPPAALKAPLPTSLPDLPLTGLRTLMPSAMIPTASPAAKSAALKALPPIPSWGGTAGGTAVGLVAGLLASHAVIGVAAGAALGLIIDVVRAKPAAPPAKLHGDVQFGMDVNFDDIEGTIVAGEIGQRTTYGSLKA